MWVARYARLESLDKGGPTDVLNVGRLPVPHYAVKYRTTTMSPAPVAIVSTARRV